MTRPPLHSFAQPLFIKAASGERFCMYYPHHPDVECRGAFIYVHPFGEEMNKSRRMAALQARAFANMGYDILHIDLLGCGDSSGEFSDARWEIWLDDLACAKTWLEKRTRSSIGLWGLRLGAILALDFARKSDSRLGHIVLWQPIVSGEMFLTQFLRMRLANELLGGGEKTSDTRSMRAFLATGEILEVAGYELAPTLAATIDALRMEALTVTGCPVHWFEIVPEAGRAMGPAAERVAAAWKRNDVELHVHLVACAPFWATQEIVECPELLSATTRLFTKPQP